MRDIDLFQLALGLVPPWMVASANFDAEKKRLDIEIDFNDRKLTVQSRTQTAPLRSNDPGSRGMREMLRYPMSHQALR